MHVMGVKKTVSLPQQVETKSRNVFCVKQKNLTVATDEVHYVALFSLYKFRVSRQLL